MLQNTEIVNPAHYGDSGTYDLHISSHMLNNRQFGFGGKPVSETLYYDPEERVLSVASELFRLLNIVEFTPEQIEEIDRSLGVSEGQTNLVLGSMHSKEMVDIDLPQLLDMLGNPLDKIIIIPMEFHNEGCLRKWEGHIKAAGKTAVRLSTGNLEEADVLIVDTKGLSDHIYASSGSKISIIGGGFSHGGSHSPAESLMAGVYTLMGEHRADHEDMIYNGKVHQRLSELPPNLVGSFVKVLLHGGKIDKKDHSIRGHLVENNYHFYEKVLRRMLELIYSNTMARKNAVNGTSNATATECASAIT